MKEWNWMYAVGLFLLTNFIVVWSGSLKSKVLRILLKIVAVITLLMALLFGLRSMS
ncbi:hypothetical protein [Thermoactinomyces sp. DSM 45892]|uniref:hypothetical protein n=1 Tax=Thermoactinomyces sp. DSM 45892 TaxID=1882753 RepID=UPI0008961424|nr:hypothetical protein [Thermoactinomyces sp. DSM 45892]SDZ10508.1 hypothetical protein SAMN05444416_113107 [Thermoactinomyces sp. DSM 45892]